MIKSSWHLVLHWRWLFDHALAHMTTNLCSFRQQGQYRNAANSITSSLAHRTERKDLSWNSWNSQTLLCCCGQFLSANTGLKNFFPKQLIPSSSLACSFTSTTWTQKRTDRKISMSVSQSTSPFYLTNYCHNWRWKLSLMLKKSFCLTTQACTVGAEAPWQQGCSSDPMGASLDSPHTSHSQTGFPHWLEPRFPTAESQFSASFTLFDCAAVTAEQKQLPLLPLRRDTEKRKSLGFCPLTV